jgi:BMFP domain-containing protein YqiC
LLLSKQELDRYNQKLAELEQRVHSAINHGSRNGDNLHKLETRLHNAHEGGGAGQLRELEKQVREAIG